MKQFYLSFAFFQILCGLAFATIINVPADQPTIQGGINQAVSGDTVLVAPGTYIENINFIGKNIVVGSWFLLGGDTTYISQTIIDGDSSGSVVTFESGEYLNTVLKGFTLRNGFGFYVGAVLCYLSSPTLENLNIENNFSDSLGGGICCSSSANPHIKNVVLSNNFSNAGGGGIACFEYCSPNLENVVIRNNVARLAGGGISCDINSSINLKNVSIFENFAEKGGGIYIGSNSYPIFNSQYQSNIYLNFSPNDGCDLYSTGVSNINVFVDTFTVLGPTNINAYPVGNFNFNILNQMIQPVDADIYVNPLGDNRNSGLSVNEPLKNIRVALLKIIATAQNPHTIYLANGIYSPLSNNEFFPIPMKDYVSLYGESQSAVILNTEPKFYPFWYPGPFLKEALIFDNSHSDTVANLSITRSTGIYCNQSDLNLKNLTIYDNIASGITCANANPYLENVIITENDGCGMELNASNPVLNNVIISFNNGDGISCNVSSSTMFNDVVITENNGRGIYASSANLALRNMKVQKNNVGIYGINSIITADSISVSRNNAAGLVCDNNSTITVDSFSVYQNGGDGINCKNSNCYLNRGILEENHDNGIYSENSDPVLDSLKIINNSDYGLYCNNANPFFSNSIITGNNHGGVKCENNSNPILHSILICNNHGQQGGGLYCDNSSPVLKSVSIIENTAPRGGGAIFKNNSHPVFDHLARCNIFLNNAIYGNDLYSENTSEITVVVDTFTVLNPTSYHACPKSSFLFDILNFKIEQVNADLYVDPAGNNTNSGLSFANPLRNIHFAISKIYADSLNPKTIFLSGGLFSPTNSGEFFPLCLTDYVSLIGTSQSQDTTILNAEHSGDILVLNQISGVNLENLTITGGGDGIWCNSCSQIQFSDLNIKNNDSHGITCVKTNPEIVRILLNNNRSGGIYFDSSNALLSNTIIEHNGGSGISCRDANPVLENVRINKNVNHGRGGGIYCEKSTPILKNVLLLNNTALDIHRPFTPGCGGAIFSSQSSLNLHNVSITNNSAESYGDAIFCSDSSNIDFQNCIVCGDSVQEIYFESTGSQNEVTITYSDILGGLNSILTNSNGAVNWLVGNIDTCANFADTVYCFLCPNSPCIDAGNPALLYNDPEDPLNPGYALWPAQGALRNDMGAYGGPGAASWNLITKIEDEHPKINIMPTLFNLSQNYPNPFNPSTTIEFDLPKTGKVILKIFNVLGEEVATLLSASLLSGSYKYEWDASGLASGVYIYRLEAGQFVQSRKMMLLK